MAAHWALAGPPVVPGDRPQRSQLPYPGRDRVYGHNGSAAAADGGAGASRAPGGSAGDLPLAPPAGAADPGAGQAHLVAAHATPSGPVPAHPCGPEWKDRCSRCGAGREHLRQSGIRLRACPCGDARYCGAACQRAHWRVHRAICGIHQNPLNEAAKRLPAGPRPPITGPGTGAPPGHRSDAAAAAVAAAAAAAAAAGGSTSV
eukprot:TRINITY_DN19829_c1_g1_i1.p2 TRINITY_DN19829_c1_g1~~TRINITY_DN19829_c1_g1_i1.p2  ORF type:complete len:226 (+),score=32.36 TRINITY_DN19829_c1_g1_i1:71-679(+)